MFGEASLKRYLPWIRVLSGLLEMALWWIYGKSAGAASTGPLCNRFPGPHTNDNRTVADLIDGNGIWNLTSISHIVDEDVLNSILNIHIPRFSNVQDHPNWMGSSNGNFSTAAAYDLINLSMMSKDGFGFGNLNFQPSSKPLYG